MNLCDDIPCADVWFQVHNEAPMFHWLSWYCEEIPHLHSCNVAGKFQLFKLPYLSSACRNSSCTNCMIRMNIIMWPSRSCELPSWTAVFLSAVRQLFLMSSSKFFSWKPPVAGTGHPLHCLSHQSAFSQCAILTFFGLAMHTAHINTVIMLNNLHSAVNSIGETLYIQQWIQLERLSAFSSEFNWRDSFGSQIRNHSM